MRYLRLFTALLAILPGLGPREILRADGGELIWRNGDKLQGHILPSREGFLNWRSPAFRTPFELDETQLNKIVFARASTSEPNISDPPSPFRITFNNGDRIFADVLGLDAEHLTFRSPSLQGDVRVKRSYLNRIERVLGSLLRYSGPDDFDQWKALGKNVQASDWQTRESGEFATTQWGAEFFREVAIPEKSEISFIIDFPNQRPNFEAGVSESPESGLLLECWDDTLVVSSGNRFQPVMKLPTSGRVELRLYWNQTTRRVKVCNANGDLLSEFDEVELKQPAIRSSNSPKRRTSSNSRDPGRLGFRLLNRTTHLLFSKLIIREWDGVSIARFDATRPRIELTSGREVIYDLDGVRLDVNEGLKIGEQRFAITEVDQILFTPDRRFQNFSSESTDSVVAWLDGSVLTGNCTSLNPLSADLAPPWHREGVTAWLNDAKEWRFPETNVPVVEPPDRIKSGDMQFGGYLGIGDSSGPKEIFTWRPAGSRNASTLSDEQDGVVTRSTFPAGTEMIGDARIFLVNDEVIAGRLLRITEDYVELTSSLTGQIQIPARFVRAVDIEGAGLITEGFQDKGWMINPETVRNPGAAENKNNLAEEGRTDDGVILTKEQASLKRNGFGNMNLLVGDRITFDAFWPSDYGVFTVRLFCSDFTSTSPSTDILISRGPQADQILVGQLKPAGGFHFSSDRITVKDRKARVEIIAQHDNVEVRINGQKALSLKVEPGRIAGNGIIFQMGGGWRGWAEVDNEIVISDFSISRSPGFLPRRVINPVAKQNTLSVPRFLRSDPPTHVIVATNGDLLRGKLKHAQGDQVRFVSRGTELDLPRSRVSAIVWLREEEPAVLDSTGKAASTDPVFQPTQQITLNDGTRLHLISVAGSQDTQSFIGLSEIIGRCEVPLQSIFNHSYGPNLKITRPGGMEHFAYTDWILKPTRDPAIPKGDGSEGDPFIGKEAPDFTIPILGQGQFALSKRKGRVIVLDFWASWCGPCVKAMPEVFEAVGFFDGQPVDFLAVNQAETSTIINQFLETRKWSGTSVGIDFDLSVSRSYEVKGIPHTVVIGKDGKIAWVHTGYSPDLGKKLATAIARALQK